MWIFRTAYIFIFICLAFGQQMVINEATYKLLNLLRSLEVTGRIQQMGIPSRYFGRMQQRKGKNNFNVIIICELWMNCCNIWLYLVTFVTGTMCKNVEKWMMLREEKVARKKALQPTSASDVVNHWSKATKGRADWRIEPGLTICLFGKQGVVCPSIHIRGEYVHFS